MSVKRSSQSKSGSDALAESGRCSGWRKPLSILLILLATLALYYPVVGFEFLAYDDDLYILKDAAVQQLSLDNLKTILLEPHVHVWYPLARLSAAFDIYMFGHEAWGHHLVNVILHFLNAAVLFPVLNMLGRRLPASGASPGAWNHSALFLTLVFAVHPQHVEAVSWVVQRKELLACLFSLAAIALHLRGRPLATAISLVLAMLSKPTAIVMPVLLFFLSLVLLDPKERNLAHITRQGRELSLPIALSLGMAALVLINTDGMLGLNDALALRTRVALYADNALHGLSNFVTLQAGSIHQPMRDYVASGSWLAGLSVLVLVLLLALASAFVFSRQLTIRVAAFGLLFYLAALAPTGGLILFGNYAFGDRYLYLSSIGLYISVYAILCGLLRKQSGTTARRLTASVLVLWLAAAFLLSSQALPRWATTWTIWRDNIARHPDSVLANYSLGHYYFEKKNFPLALRHFGMVVESGSETFRVVPRVTSALYMAEIFCAAGEEEAAVHVLAKIPQLGGDLSAVDGLMSSLRFSGHDACHERIRRWREASGG